MTHADDKQHGICDSWQTAMRSSEPACVTHMQQHSCLVISLHPQYIQIFHNNAVKHGHPLPMQTHSACAQPQDA